MSVIKRLEVTPIINGVGPATRLGGLPLSEGVLDAMRLSSSQSFRMEELHLTAGSYISNLLKVPGALVTCGASAAISLATAVCLTGNNISRIADLPIVENGPKNVIIQKSHRDPYDHAVTAVGGVIKEIGFPTSTFPNELESALDSSIAAILWRAGKTGDLLDLATTCKIAHSFNVPVIVDAALFVTPIERLDRYFQDGADFVAISGGKALRGPHTSGLLFAQPSNIRTAMLHHLDMDERPGTWTFPEGANDKTQLPRNGIARAMKVGKEQILGLVVAIEEHLINAEYSKGDLEINACESELKKVPGVTVTRVFDEAFMVDNLHVAFEKSLSADDLYLKLASGEPRVILGQEFAWRGTLTINPMALIEGEGVKIAEKIRSIVKNS